ncbi:MAG TPA: M3 family metallopeptidase [Bdellovibrionota bacterium]|jgi:thimet oligopeptidase|nr:M3 family metallopeptidase [Bdellovibrionota bacterium]
MKKRFFLTSLITTATALTSCSSQTPVASNSKLVQQAKAARAIAQVPEAFASEEGIPWDFRPGEITQLCGEFIGATRDKLDAIAAVPAEKRSFQTTLLPYETTWAEFSQMVSPLDFVKDVHLNEKIRDESSLCVDQLSEFIVAMGIRRDLYEAVKDVAVKGAEQIRLKDETVKAFEHGGLKLDDVKLAKFKTLQTELAKKSKDFQDNINKDQSSLLFTKEQLAGAPEAFLASLERNGDKFVVKATGPAYMQVTDNVTVKETRRQMLLMWDNRAHEVNKPLFNRMIELRQEIATLMGYATWADYQTAVGRVAKSGQEVWNFLNSLKAKLKEGNQSDLRILKDLANKMDPKGGAFMPWDIRFYTNQYKKSVFQVDGEQLREYFPSDFVVAQMFDVYSKLLGVQFQKVDKASVWSPDVGFYRITDTKTKKLMAYFYADFFPRDGKFTHAAAFPLRPARRLADGSYAKPIAAIVANFNPPANGKPSLLSHDDVETLFHEFGHIMHMTLTKAPYASLSGASVATDFVEAPSQMLENWVWEPSILAKISGHYTDTKKKLPEDLVKRMIEARNFQISYFYTRQLLFSITDMTYHSNPGAIDTSAVALKLYADIIGLNPTQGSHFETSWGHMAGYDAGYYSYLWADVYASDMFTMFEKGKLLNATVGGKYRKSVLESGNMRDANVLLKEFLGRDANPNAFYKRLGLKP